MAKSVFLSHASPLIHNVVGYCLLSTLVYNDAEPEFSFAMIFLTCYPVTGPIRDQKDKGSHCVLPHSQMRVPIGQEEISVGVEGYVKT